MGQARNTDGPTYLLPYGPNSDGNVGVDWAQLENWPNQFVENTILKKKKFVENTGLVRGVWESSAPSKSAPLHEKNI